MTKTSLQLVAASIKYEQQIQQFAAAFGNVPEGIPGTSMLGSFSPDVPAWLTSVAEHSSWETIPAGRVPGQQYLALIAETATVVGMVNLRFELNEYLLNFGGHIGYAIKPCHQGKGYGTQVLHLTLQEAGKLGLRRVLVTCADENIASAKVIEKNHGRLADKRKDPIDGLLTRRYWLDVPIDLNEKEG